MRHTSLPKSVVLIGVVSLAAAGVMLADPPAVAAEEVPGVDWTRQFGTGRHDRGWGVAVDATGVYVTGATVGVLPGQTAVGSYDVFVRKYGTDGTEVWTRQFGTSTDDWGLGVAVDTGGVYVTGDTWGALPGHTSAGEWDVFVRKYDLDGTSVRSSRMCRALSGHSPK